MHHTVPDCFEYIKVIKAYDKRIFLHGDTVCGGGILWGELPAADSENSSCFTANYVATGQTVVYIAATLVNLLPSLHISSACV